MDETLREFYRDLGFLDDRSNPLPLHIVCKRRNECWADAEGRLPPESCRCSYISEPWFGRRYPELRLLIIAENRSKNEALLTNEDQVKNAQVSLMNMYRRISVNDAQDNLYGSFLWHRITPYLAAFAQQFGLLAIDNDANGYPLGPIASRLYDCVAFTQHIKCSPSNNNGKPTRAMWQCCGSHVLQSEIFLAEPEHILVLGKSHNASYLRHNVLDKGSWNVIDQLGDISYIRAEIFGNPLNVWVVPHPTAWLTTERRAATIPDMRALLKRSCIRT